MSARTSRIEIPDDIHPGFQATLAMWHLNDALHDGSRFTRRLPDEEVRRGREGRDERIIAEARRAEARPLSPPREP